MIVRIMGEGQVRLADSHLTELNKLDDELLAEMETRRRSRASAAPSRRSWTRSANWATPLPDDSLEPSELILPSPDATLEEVREMLSDDGLIPG